MSKNIKTMLESKIETYFEELENLNIGSKEHASAVDDFTKLYRLTIEESKIEQENHLKKNESENLFIQREIEVREKKIDRIVRIGISIVEIVLPLTFYAFWMKRGLEFEKTGTFTSTTFRGLFSHFRTTKK